MARQVTRRLPHELIAVQLDKGLLQSIDAWQKANNLSSRTQAMHELLCQALEAQYQNAPPTIAGAVFSQYKVEKEFASFAERLINSPVFEY